MVEAWRHFSKVDAGWQGENSSDTFFMATISEALAIAIQHHQAGRLQAAEQIYRQILQVEPNHADAIHLLGVIASPSGQARLLSSTLDGQSG